MFPEPDQKNENALRDFKADEVEGNMEDLHFTQFNILNERLRFNSDGTVCCR